MQKKENTRLREENKNLRDENEAQKLRINAVEAENDTLKRRINIIESENEQLKIRVNEVEKTILNLNRTTFEGKHFLSFWYHWQSCI